jgi:hypothetical protein
MQVLEGRKLYENGLLLGPFSLGEGERYGPLVILEDAEFSEVHVSGTTEDDLQVISEANGRKTRSLLTLEGIFQRADTKNHNGRIYPKKLWEKLLTPGSRLLRRVDEGECFGEADHPCNGETQLQRVAALTTKLWKDSHDPKTIHGRISILDTQKGRDLLAIHEGGGRLGVSSRGTGTVVRVDGNDVVQEDYDCHCWDVVASPSTPGAYPSEVHEATNREGKAPSEPLESKESGMQLADIQSRFTAYREKDLGTLSEDAREMVLDEIRSLQKHLDGSFPGAETRASRLMTEITHFLNTAQTNGKAVKETLTEDVEVPAKSPEKRPRSFEEAAHAFSLLKADAPDDLRRAYRSMYLIEGALKPYEFDALREAESSPLDSGNNPSLLHARALIGESAIEITGSTEEAILEEARSRFGESDHPVLLYLDENATFVTSLLERQSTRAQEALDQVQRSRAQLTEVSAKQAALVQVVEAMARRTRGAEHALEERTDEYEASLRLLEAIRDEVDMSSLKGAVIALAATHRDIPKIASALSEVTSIEEAVRVVRKLRDETQVTFEREPTNDGAVQEALRKDTEARKEISEASPQPFSSRRTKSEETVQEVLDHMRRRGLGK